CGEIEKITLSGDEPGFLRALYCLCSPPRRELVEESGGVRLHRVLADEQSFGHLAIAQSGRDRFEDLELSRRDAKLRQSRLISLERSHDRHHHFAHDYCLARSGKLETEPDTECRENQRDDAAVDLE